MDSMVNRYTADRRLRHDDAYTPGGEGGKRPDRCTIVYAQRCREAFKDVPIVLGGIEASLRRIAHYDYWSDKVRRSVLVDAKADLLLYGNAERAVVEVAHRLAAGEAPRDLDDIRGVALFRRVPDDYTELHADDLDSADEGAARHEGRHRDPAAGAASRSSRTREAYARASRVLHRESNPGNARPLVQRHGDRDLWLNAAADPADHRRRWTRVYDLPYARAPHPSYGDAKIPAWDMIKFSVTIMRGCFGGCTFCSITEHEGRIIQNRSEGSILREIETDPRQDAGLHRRHLRHRRPDRQHVPHGLQGPEDRGGVPAAVLRLPGHLPEPQHHPRRPDPALSQGARGQGRQEGDGRLRRALRPRGEEPRIRQGARHPSRRRLSEDRARAHRARPARQDDEAGHRRLRPLQADVRRRGRSRPARNIT